MFAGAIECIVLNESINQFYLHYCKHNPTMIVLLPTQLLVYNCHILTIPYQIVIPLISTDSLQKNENE